MQTERLFIRWLRRALVLTLILTGAVSATEVPLPHVSIQGHGNYLVSYQACTQCSGHGLQEYQPQSAGWLGLGSGDQSFANQPPGTYQYRVAYYLYVGRGGYQPAFGPAVEVIVDENGRADLPTRPPLADQFAAEYSILSGHIDGDGKRDLLIRRSSEILAGRDGTIGDVLLRQTSQGSLEASLPNQWELSVASSWPAANLDVQKRDVNIDGYLDLVLQGVDHADGLGQIDNQILIAPGTSPFGLAPDVLAVDEGLAQFSRDINRHLIDPDYYPNNAPLGYSVVALYSWNCGWIGYYSVYDSYDPQPWNCMISPWYVYVVYPDFSSFDQDAMEVARNDYRMIHGYESTSTGMQNIANTIASVLGISIGGWDINELLGETEAVTTEEERRGMELFAVLAAISDAVEDEASEEESEEVQAPDSDRVLLKGRRVLGQGPFHTLVEYRGSTVSAYDSDPRMLFDGNLVSQVNWPRDHPSLTMRMGYIDGPSTPLIYWSSILLADSRYGDDLRYDLFPNLGQGGYNSNSFVSGLVQATLGLPTIQLETFVGGEQPVPVSAFN